MVDLATLGFAVDSRPLKQAATDLQAVSAAGKNAEAAARGVESAAAGMSSAMGGMASATSKAQSELLRLDDYARRADGTVRKLTATQKAQLDAIRLLVAQPSISRGEDIAAYGRQLDGLRAKYNPLFAAQRQYLDQLAEIRNAQKVGALSAMEASNAVSMSKVNFARQVTEMQRQETGGLARHTMQNLSYQASDVVSQLSSGTGVMQIAAQQGPQIVDAFGGIADVSKRVLSAITPMRVAIGGTTAMLLAAALAAKQYSDSQKELSLSLTGVGRSSGFTVDSLNAVAEATARLDGLSLSAARSTAAVFAGTGRIDKSVVAGLMETSRLYALQTGQEQAGAAKELASAFVDPARGAEMLNQKLGILDATALSYIRSQDAMGNRGAAQKALLDAMAPALDRATDHMSKYERAILKVGNAWDLVKNGVGHLLVGPTNEQELARLERLIAEIKAAPKSFWSTGSAGLQGLETQRDKLKVQIDYDQRTAKAKADDQLWRDNSQKAADAVNSIIGGLSEFKQAGEWKALLENMIATGRGTDDMREALARLNGQMGTAKNVVERDMQRALEDRALQIQQSQAYTLEQRLTVEGERARIEALRSGRGALMASVEAETARAKVLADISRQSRDMLRDAQMDSKLIGLSPYERQRQQIINERDRWMQQNSGSSPVYQGGSAMYGPSLPMIDSNTRTAVEAYTRMAAVARGIDENIAARVIRQESGFNFRATNISPREESYGPMQLNAMGGLGAVALGRGINIRDPNTWRQQIDFGMDVVARDGWRQWYGARDVGIGRWDGINGRGQGGTTLDSASQPRAFQQRLSDLNRSSFDEPYNSATRAIDAQEAAMSRLRQTIGASPQQQAALNAEIQLYTQLVQSGVPITKDMENRIKAYGESAGVSAEKIRQIQFAQRQLDELRGLEGDVFRGIASDMINGARQGKDAWQLLGDTALNSLNKITDKLASMMIEQMLLNSSGGMMKSLFGGLFGGAGGGFGGAAWGSGGLYANGGVFSGGEVIPFANGGVLDRPSYFPMSRGRTGLMGEAGPEAIIPLRRGPDGKLGVHSSGGGAAAPMNVTVINQNGSEVQTRQTNGPHGPGLEIILKEAVKGMVASGDLDRVMGQRFSMNPMRG